MTPGPGKDDEMLEALFSEAAQVNLSDDLMDRIVQDAVEHQPKPEALVPQQTGLWARLVEAVGGWASVGGLATAAIAGVYVGFADPTLLETVGVLSTTDSETVLVDDFAFFDDSLEG